ncbi:MAG: hypothetical protein C4K60_01325 [Ideonella sp. MAG2]|nr:MAG: hypothetical protein C4K60_01325 [Ideonella sp. MAG2]
MNFKLHPLVAGVALLAATLSHAADSPDIKSLRVTATEAKGLTLAERESAKTLMPRVNMLPDAVFDYTAAANKAAVGKGQGQLGSKGGAKADHLFQVESAAPGAQDGSISPDAVGTGGLQFTSSRVSPKTLDTTFPVRTVGKLYFKIGSSTYMCTGSVIKPGVVLTAGHCVHSGNASSTGWYNSFEFIPGYRKVGTTITKPYGSWTNYVTMYTSTDWYNSGGAVPNAGDWALIVFNKDASNKRVGDYTGWLGWAYPSMIGKHMTVLGYPGNHDLGGQLHRVDSMVTDYGSLNTGTYGSDMQGGSSGGPNVLNWRVDYTDSSTLPSENWGNVATSVVSWGYVSTTPKVQGGSQFNGVFANMVNAACTSYPWAC